MDTLNENEKNDLFKTMSQEDLAMLFAKPKDFIRYLMRRSGASEREAATYLQEVIDTIDFEKVRVKWGDMDAEAFCLVIGNSNLDPDTKSEFLAQAEFIDSVERAKIMTLMTRRQILRDELPKIIEEMDNDTLISSLKKKSSP